VSDAAAADGARVEVTVPREAPARRLDQALAALLPRLSRTQVQRLIRDGRVTVDGAPARRPGAAVTGGAQVAVEMPVPEPAAPVPQALPLTILYQDTDIVAVDKPAGMVVHPAAGHAEGTLVNALLHHVADLSGFAGERRPGIVHRLDKGTSGVMIVAKHDVAHRQLTRQFGERAVEKEYVALLWGRLEGRRSIDAPIGRDPVHRKRMSVRARRARAAATEVEPLERLGEVTLARVRIGTGRTHQIRVHLQAIGHPVVGDALYGGTRRRWPPALCALAGLDRPFLHARRIAFAHPSTGRWMVFEAPLPGELETALAAVRDEHRTDVAARGRMDAAR
jgi:23S rRNA pseudouridine1911/1915/1917 synthase